MIESLFKVDLLLCVALMSHQVSGNLKLAHAPTSRVCTKFKQLLVSIEPPGYISIAVNRSVFYALSISGALVGHKSHQIKKEKKKLMHLLPINTNT